MSLRVCHLGKLYPPAPGRIETHVRTLGCPVINAAIAGSGVPWVSPHEVSGLSVLVNDPIALADSAARIIAEPGLRDRLARGGRRRAAREFDHRVMADRTLALYRRVLGPPPVQWVIDRSTPVAAEFTSGTPL